MFNKIGIMGCEKMILIEDGLFAENAAELRWLFEQGIIFDPQLHVLLHEVSSLDSETKKILDDSKELIDRHKEDIEQIDIAEELKPHMEKEGLLEGVGLELLESIRKKPETLKQMTTALMSGELLLRPLSAYHRNSKNVDAYPLFNVPMPQLAQQISSVGDVIDITINHLPIPDDSTSWEQIIDFRNDPDTEIKFRRFRVWMNEIIRAKLTSKEIEDKLAWLLDEYRQHMELHRMKTNTSTLETILVSLGDRKFGDIVKIPFSVKHRQIALLEAEAKAPGREIAFISKAQETFR